MTAPRKSYKRDQAIAALLEQPTITAAASAVGVGEKTLRRLYRFHASWRASVAKESSGSRSHRTRRDPPVECRSHGGPPPSQAGLMRWTCDHSQEITPSHPA